MLQRTPAWERSDGPAAWWSWFLDSPMGRRISFAAVIVAAALCVAMILTHHATMTTVPPTPRFAR